MLRIVLLICAALLAWQTTACTTAAPPSSGQPAAGVVLQQILTECWGVTQLKDLDGTRPDHTRAFECARPQLLEMARQYPDAAEPHRLLAWGYYFAMQDEDAARAEYQRAAQIYGERARPTEQAEMLVQLANLAFKYDQTSGCDLLKQALAIDANNERAVQLRRNFNCMTQPSPTATPMLNPLTGP